MSRRFQLAALLLLVGSLGATPVVAQTAGAGATPGGAAGVGASPGGAALPAAGGSEIAPASSSPVGGGVGSLQGSPGGAISPPSALNQPGGQETLQGPGIAAPAAQGTIGAPGVAGGLYGAGQAQLPPGEAASTVNQKPVSSGVDMPLTGQNARDDSGASGAAGSAAQTPFNPDEVRSLEQQRQRPQTSNDRSQPGAVEGWRFRWHDDLWWYWTPQKSWVVWQRDRWVPYEREMLYARPTRTSRSQLRPQSPPVNSAPTAANAQAALGEFRPGYMGAGLYSRAVNKTGRPEGTTAL